MPIFPSHIHAEQSHIQQLADCEINSHSISCRGYCPQCKREHTIVEGTAKIYCHILMDLLSQKKRLDITFSDCNSNPQFSTKYLFSQARGQMFGVLVFERSDKSHGVIPAFSGQYNSQWSINGWAPPLLDPSKFQAITCDVDKKIKRLSRKMSTREKESTEWHRLRSSRKCLSQQLMKDIHNLYSITNFAGQRQSLYQVYQGDNGIPTGTGDCCAPKLLNYAATHHLKPLGLAEFYWGKENRSKTKTHGNFYASCQEKCAPILGFMLCGLTAG